MKGGQRGRRRWSEEGGKGRERKETGRTEIPKRKKKMEGKKMRQTRKKDALGSKLSN